MSFVEFEPVQLSFDKVEEPFQLTDESATSLRTRLASQWNFGGTAVHGLGLHIADRLPGDISPKALPEIAADLAEQVGCGPVATSIMQGYREKPEAA